MRIHPDSVPATPWSIGIRFKLSVAFVAFALIATAFACAAIFIQIDTIERASLWQAERVAKVIAGRAFDDPDSLQSYVVSLRASRQADLVFVDTNRKDLADADPQDIGTVFDHDLNGEVGQTLQDGRTRSFVVGNKNHRRGVRNMVVPVRVDMADPASPIIGAAIVDYTPVYDDVYAQLLAAQLSPLILFAVAAAVCVLAGGFYGLRVATQIARRLGRLQRAFSAVADGHYDASVSVLGHDEIDRLNAGFNTMALALKDSQEKLHEYGRSLQDKVADRVAALRESEARMAYLAQYDPLTGLPNRNLFRDRLTQAMARADREQKPMALMFADIDHFKKINDSLGHAIGDRLLKAVAQRLRETLREVDTIARLGGDEFVLILEAFSDPADVGRVAQRIKQSLAKPVFVDDHEFAVTASVGIALYSGGTNDGDNLLQAADIAMYRAKDAGRNTYAMFEPEMALRIGDRAVLEALLRHALERDEFTLHYQPKLALDGNRVVGVEALLRWNSPELGSVSPTRFIPVAEELGLIVAIGEWVLRTACRQGRMWQEQGLPPLTMAVNLSPRQLHDPNLVEMVSDVLRETSFPANLLELELTEGVIMENVESNVGTLNAIRALGASLAIDDFGTGYSSLAYLTQLPIQTLKIDRAFIMTMVDDSNAMTLVSTIVTLAHSLNLKVVAEGVETPEQQRLLYLLRCDQIQGFGFSRPVSAQALAALVLANAASADLQDGHRPLARAA